MCASSFKHLIASGITCVLVANTVSAQEINNPLNPATTKAVSVPRITAAKRRAVFEPMAGTVVFQTDSIAGFYYYTGVRWLSLAQQNERAQPRVLRNGLPGSGTMPDRVITIAGRLTPGRADGVAASFSSPHGVAVSSNGTVYVADTDNHRIRTISPAGMVSVLAGSTKGYSEGTGPAAHFNSPTGITIDSEGTVYVADAGNNRIRKISPSGVVSTLAGEKQGFADGIGAAAAFHNPYAVALGQHGALYVADASNDRICRIARDGTVTTLAGRMSGFDHPTGIAVDLADNVYVADSNNNRICKIATDGTISILAGSTSGFADGPTADARFNHPASLAVTDEGTLYVAEQGNNRMRVISPQGVVSTLAGTGIATFADGPPAKAAFNLPVGIALDASGALYVADMGNNCIRKVAIR